MKPIMTVEREKRRVFFREALLDRIQTQIGKENPDQEIKEKILTEICAQITSVYIGCFDKIEQSLGEEVWAYDVPPEIYNQIPPDAQEHLMRRAKIWSDCKLAIKSMGNQVISNVIGLLNKVNFETKEQEKTNE